MRKRVWLRLLCLAVMLISILQLWRIGSSEAQTEEAFGQLRTQILQLPAAPQQTEAAAEAPGRTFNAKFAELYEKNPHFVGWLRVGGTRIDYPVVQTPEDPEYYLERNFEGRKDAHGVPFLDGACDAAASGNLVIYGHNMMDGTMFAGLARFREEAFRQQEHLISFDTIWGDGTWQVIAVFAISVADAESFPYHRVLEFSEDGITPNDYLNRCSYYALWYDDTELPPDTRLLTLSTCEYTQGDGRFVVVAKKIA